MIYGQLPIVTIETTDSKDGHHARLLIDGNLDTFYADNLDSLGAEIKLTLLKKYRIYGLALNLKEAVEPVEYDLSYYQESENTFISIKKGVLDVTEALQVINFSPVTTNKLVIKFFTKLTGVGEIRAFGYVEKQVECEYQPTITIPQLPPIAVISSNILPLNEVIKFPLKVIASFTESVDPNNKKLTFKSFIKQGETILAESDVDSIKTDIKTEGEFTILLEVTDEDQLKDIVSYNFTVVKKELPEQYDKNGVVIFKDFEYTDVENYNPLENYQQDSRRLDFESPRMDSVICGAYIKATGDDEYSAKLGGGSHNDSKPLNGRCYIIGINFNLTKIRIRLEPDHSKDYITYLEKDISEFGFTSGVGRTIGLAYGKINEENGVRLIAWIDPDGLDLEGKPSNNYIKVLDELITDPIWYTPYDVTDFQNTIRVDGQDNSFEYKYAYAREVDGFTPVTQEIDVDAGDSQTITTSTLPYQLTLNGTVSGADNFTVLWNSSDSTINISPSSNLTSTATISTYGSFTFTLSATTSTRTESDSITVTVVEPSTSTDVLKFTKDGQEVQFKLTGKKVAMEKGSNHRNGQRYNVNHFYENYIMLGKFKTGKGQEQIEMKTDGPNHGGCTQLNNCMWYEPAIYMNGKVKFGTEYPHPTNHDVDLNVIQYHKDLGYSIDQTTIQYAVGAFYDKDGKRNIIQAATKNLNGIPELNIWAIENGQIFPSKHLPRDLKKIMQENDEGGLEAEIRMHKATNSDTSMTDCYVYEIEPLT